VDTNVVLARFAPKDPVHAAARKFFSSPGERIISPVSIVEMNAVLSREFLGLEVPTFLSGEQSELLANSSSDF
jgi:predicted nucleic acid-binding protein